MSWRVKLRYSDEACRAGWCKGVPAESVPSPINPYANFLDTAGELIGVTQSGYYLRLHDGTLAGKTFNAIHLCLGISTECSTAPKNSSRIGLVTTSNEFLTRCAFVTRSNFKNRIWEKHAYKQLGQM